MNANDPAIARNYGKMLLAGSSIAGLLYCIALARRSYLAVAVPMTAIVVVSLAALGTLGRLLMTTPDEPQDF
ncbi:MAG TPA: hypothetical protein VN697_00055 [Tepidiformaceae bacterium]|nr:hypothetical protein [Tepidiformaceae bacterium]